MTLYLSVKVAFSMAAKERPTSRRPYLLVAELSAMCASFLERRMRSQMTTSLELYPCKGKKVRSW